MNRQVVLVLALAAWVSVVTAAVAAPDNLDGGRNAGWSPDGRWLAFNWPNKDELLFVAVDTGDSYLLKGMGLRSLDSNLVISPAPPSQTGREPSRLPAARIVASPGYGKLTLIGWSPDSRLAAYRFGKDGRALFSPFEQRVTRELKPGELLPWANAAELRLTFELVLASADERVQYVARVQKADGTTVKELHFQRPPEVRLVSAARFRDNSFLATNKDFLLYPRWGKHGWQLVREPVTGPAPPQPVTAASPEMPYEWHLTADDRYLMVADRLALTVGPVDHWDQARKIPLANRMISARWSPAGRFLAYADRESLFVLPRDQAAPVLVSDRCAPRFWGWRGRELYFGNARTDPSNLLVVQPDKSFHPEEIVPLQTWQSAPRELSISPNGGRLVCLVNSIDGTGQAHWQLCQYLLQRGEDSQKVLPRLEQPDLVGTNAVAWQVLAATLP